jgi:hypothetical protein
MPELSFRKGDLVKFQLGIRPLEGAVKEDRGPIGVKGRRLYLVEFRPEPQSASLALIELPGEQLQPVKNTVSIE